MGYNTLWNLKMKLWKIDLTMTGPRGTDLALWKMS